MAEAKLTYFNGRGKAEIIRFMLSAAGIQFSQVFLTKRQEMLDLIASGVLTFNQLPLLEIDGLKLVQSGAIVRYVARRGGLYGSGDKEAAQIDKLFEGSRDFNDSFMPMGFLDKDAVLQKAKDKALPRYLPAFDKVLKENGSGYLVGSTLSMADVGLFEAISNTIEFIGPDSLKDFPTLKQFYDRISALPKIAAFLKGPQRQRPNDERYVAEVKTVLAW